MWMMEDSLPNIKSYFRGIDVPKPGRMMLVRFMISIHVRQGRNSAMHAASVLSEQPRHRAQPARFLGRFRWRAMNVLGQVVMKLLDNESWSGEYILSLDSTLVGHQGESMENTYSTGNRKRRPAKNRRYSKYKYAQKSCHCFVYLEWTRSKKLDDSRLTSETKSTWRRQRAFGIRQAILIGIQVRQQKWIQKRLKTKYGLKTIAKKLTTLLATEYRCAV